jgi:hypothetical protein
MRKLTNTLSPSPRTRTSEKLWLQGCVIVALQSCVIVALQGCIIIALQCCVIGPCHVSGIFLPF